MTRIIVTSSNPHAVEVFDGKHRVRHAEAPKHAANQIARGIIGFDEAQNVIALLGERNQGLRDRAHAGARDEAIAAALQFGDGQFELPCSGI